MVGITEAKSGVWIASGFAYAAGVTGTLEGLLPFGMIL